MANFFKSIGNFLGGTPGQINQVSNLRPDQEGLSNQLVNAGMGQGAGGAFGQSADYYRGLLSDDSQDYDAFSAPALRQYYQDIAPNISEQFAGMGAGGLSSSGFRNAQTQGGVDLAERLGQLRASLRQSGASGLQNIGQLGLQNFQQSYQQPGAPGFLSELATATGIGLGTVIGGPAGAAIGGGLGSWFGGKGNKVGANVYQGSNQASSPQIPPAQSLPNFLQRP